MIGFPSDGLLIVTASVTTASNFDSAFVMESVDGVELLAEAAGWHLQFNFEEENGLILPRRPLAFAPCDQFAR